MINPISNSRAADASTSKATAPKPAPQSQAPQTPKSGAVSQDQVTLKHTGDVDNK
jgi:hypothetical protein